MTATASVSAVGRGLTPRIIYGTAWKEQQTAALVSAAIRHGFRAIDTACQPKHYHEAGVGAAVAASLLEGLSRADLYLQTKFTPLSGQDPARVPYDPHARLATQVAQSFKSSQRNLGVSEVDCLVLHSPVSDEALPEVWQAMEAIVDQGGARQLGISNCYSLDYLESLHASARIKPAVLQNRFYAATGYDRELRAFCRQQHISYQSFWTLTANPHLLVHERLRSLAANYGRTPAQILFRYLTQDDIVPLTGTRSETHMREAQAIFEFELALLEREALSTLF
jgi:diketogulonate reductase-like aldo/keto reductase